MNKITAILRFHSHLPKSLAAMQVIVLAGIAIGTATLLIALSIAKGFQDEYQRSILNFNAHVVILKGGEITDLSEPIELAKSLKPTNEEIQYAAKYKRLIPFWKITFGIYHRLTRWHDDLMMNFEIHPFIVKILEHFDPRILFDKLPEGFKNFSNRLGEINKKSVAGITPFLYREALAIGGGTIKGIVLKGVDPATVRDVNNMRLNLFSDASLDLALQSSQGAPKIVIGQALADRLQIRQTSKITLLIPQDKTHNRFVEAQVAGIFESGLYDYDSQFALISINDCRKMFATGPVAATGVEIKLNDPYKADLISEIMNDALPAPYQTITWRQLNNDLFEALSIEKLLFTIIMGMLVVVATFNITGLLVLLIIYRTHEVSVLKAIGMPSKALEKIFITGGIVIGLVGSMMGVGLGVVISYAVKQFALIHIEPEIYFVSSLPIDISWPMCGMIVFATIFMCYITSRMAAKRLKHLNISEGLKY